MQYREQTYKEYAILFGDEREREQKSDRDIDKNNENEGDTIGSKYGWYCLIHKMAGADILKMEEVTKQSLSAALNWLSYTKEIEMEQERLTKH